MQTLYLAWGSKRALLRAYMESTLTNGEREPGDVLGRFAALSARHVIEELAALFGETAARSALGWELYRDASASDPAIAADWTELQLLRRITFAKILNMVPASEYRTGLTRASAADTAWAIASPETYSLLTAKLNYTLAEYREWLSKTLIVVLLDKGPLHR